MFQGFLKQSTQATVLVTLISSTDHIAGKTGLSAGLSIYATKAGAAAAAITPTVAEIDATNMPGQYSLVFTTTHTNTLGDLSLHITGSGMDPWDGKWQVTARLLDDLAYPATSGRSMAVDASGNVAADAKLWLGGAIPAVNVTGVPKVDATHLLGTAWLTPGTAGTPDVNAKLWNGLTTVALPLVPTVAGRTLDVSVTGEGGVDWANVGGQATAVNLSATTVKTLTDAPADSSGVTTLLARLSAARATKLDALSLRDGTAQAGAAGSITLDAGASATDSLYNGLWVVIESGTGAGQVRLITGYTGATKVATVAPNWTTNPFSDSVFALVSAGKVSGATLVDTLTTYTGNTPQTGDAFARLGAPAGASVSADIAAVKAVLPTALVGGRMDSSVGAMAAAVLTNSAFAANAITAAITDSTFDDSIADALLGRVNGIETGVTPKQALRAMASALAGVLAGAATTTVTTKEIGGITTDRITATVDANGNRSAIVLVL